MVRLCAQRLGKYKLNVFYLNVCIPRMYLFLLTKHFEQTYLKIHVTLYKI